MGYLGKSYRVVSFDLDGTLTESRKTIEKSMVDLLAKLTERYLVIIISGSSYENMQKQIALFLNYADKSIFDNVLLMPANGSQTYNYKSLTGKWELTNVVEMPEYLKTEVINVLKSVIDSERFDIPLEHTGLQIQDRETQVSFSALGIDADLEQKKLWDPDQSKRKKIIAHIAPLLPDTDIFIAGTTTIDILPKGITKGVMLKKIMKSHGLDYSDLLFIGDALYEGGNDHEVRKEGLDTIPTTGPSQTEDLIKDILSS